MSVASLARSNAPRPPGAQPVVAMAGSPPTAPCAARPSGVPPRCRPKTRSCSRCRTRARPNGIARTRPGSSSNSCSCRTLPAITPFDERFAFLFNSYYVSAGPRHARPQRGLITRPNASEVDGLSRACRCRDRDADRRRPTTTLLARIAPILEIGLNHEQQHQELILTDILHAFAQNPTAPAYDAAWRMPTRERARARLRRRAGRHPPHRPRRRRLLLRQRRPGARRADQRGAHRARADHQSRVAALHRGRRLHDADAVAVGRLGERRRPKAGKRPAIGADTMAPGTQMTLAGLAPIDPDAPVSHVSYYEADAFARWAGKASAERGRVGSRRARRPSRRRRRHRLAMDAQRLRALSGLPRGRRRARRIQRQVHDQPDGACAAPRWQRRPVIRASPIATSSIRRIAGSSPASVSPPYAVSSALAIPQVPHVVCVSASRHDRTIRAFARDVAVGTASGAEAAVAKILLRSQGQRAVRADHAPARVLSDPHRDRDPDATMHTRSPRVFPAGAALVEFGTGSSRKARILIDAADKLAAYVPVDISAEWLAREAADVARDFPRLKVLPVVADFMQEFPLPAETAGMPRVGFFPGSTIGNLEPARSPRLPRARRQSARRRRDDDRRRRLGERQGRARCRLQRCGRRHCRVQPQSADANEPRARRQLRPLDVRAPRLFQHGTLAHRDASRQPA